MEHERRYSMKDYRSEVWIEWCPGCGNYGILTAMLKAFEELQLDPKRVVVVAGIGCSGRIPNYYRVNGVHTLHGRAIPFAIGIKLANPKLVVIVHGGDGDLLGIGMGHFVALGRRNIDVTVVIHDNGVYGLTKGQASPTLPRGVRTKALPRPNMQDAINPLVVALASGYTFVARAFALDVDYLKKIFVEAIRHRGASVVDVLQPCVTYNNIFTAQYYRKRIYRLEDEGWDPLVKDPSEARPKYINAMRKALESGDRIPIGIFYRNPYVPSYEERVAQLNPYYPKEPPSRQVVEVDGRPVVTTEDFRKIFADRIVKVRKSRK